jgi:hypothetical protein
MADVPIVDLARPLDEVASTIRDACVRHGFFFVVNHGVARDVVDGMFAASSDFFSLPDDAKRTVAQDGNNRGWTPFGEETLDPKRQTTGDSKEGYYIGRECEDDEIGLPLRGKNLWPDESSLGLRAFKAPMTAYYDACVALARRVMPALALALGLSASFLDDKFTRPTALLRPLRYAARASDPAAGVFAAGAHRWARSVPFVLLAPVRSPQRDRARASRGARRPRRTTCTVLVSQRRVSPPREGRVPRARRSRRAFPFDAFRRLSTPTDAPPNAAPTSVASYAQTPSLDAQRLRRAHDPRDGRHPGAADTRRRARVRVRICERRDRRG